MPKKRNRKRNTAHHHPSSNKQKRLALEEKKKAKEYQAWLDNLKDEKSKITTASILHKLQIESMLSKGKKGSHRKR